jgi:hypothetical protein
MTNPNQPFRRPSPRPVTDVRLPQLPAGERPVIPVDWFRRMPQGGTVYRKQPFRP